MVAGDLEAARQALEQALAVGVHGRHLAVHRHRAAAHHAAEHLVDGLVAEADPQHRHLRSQPLDQFDADAGTVGIARSEEHTSELQSLMRISYAVFCLKKKTQTTKRY